MIHAVLGALCLAIVTTPAPGQAARGDRDRTPGRNAPPEPPDFAPRGGLFVEPVEVALACPTAGARIHYTTDGSEPTASSPHYAQPIAVTRCTWVRARAYGPDGTPGEVVSQNFIPVTPELASFRSELPLVVLSAHGHPFDRDRKSIAGVRLLLPGAGGSTRLTGPADLDTRGLVNIRGRASLRYPKRSYTLRFVDELDEPQPVAILGMPRDADWVLYAPYPDKTLMRDVLAYELSRQAGTWAPRTRFVEVFVNESGDRLTPADYMGVYVFEERVKRDRHRVNLVKLGPEDNDFPAITGGYLFKKDHVDRGYYGQPDLLGGGVFTTSSSNKSGFPTAPGGFPADPAGFLPTYTGRSSSSSSSRRSGSSSTRRGAVTNYVGQPQRNAIVGRVTRYFSTDEGEMIEEEDEEDAGFKTVLRTNQFHFVEPEADELTAVQKAWLKAHLNQVEQVIYGPAFTDPLRGYASVIDPDSFIDHHLLVEVTKNPDGFRFSTFFTKNRGERIRMEPIWDWNLSFGNCNGKQAWIPEYWLWPQLDDKEYTWFRRLFEDPDFGQRYADRWAQLRATVFATSNLLGQIDHWARILQGPQQRNFERWPILGLGVNPNWFVGASYAEEVAWMKDYITKRLAWIERQFLAPPAARPAADRRITLAAGPGNIHFTLDGTDPRAPGGQPAGAARLYEAPIALGAGQTLTARVRHQGRWSPALVFAGP